MTAGPRETAYDNLIDPLMLQIIEIAKEHGIPMLATFELDVQEDHAEDDPLMCSTIIDERTEGVPAPVSRVLRELSETLYETIYGYAAKARAASPAALAETISTDAEGRTTITIRRVS